MTSDFGYTRAECRKARCPYLRRDNSCTYRGRHLSKKAWVFTCAYLDSWNAREEAGFFC